MPGKTKPNIAIFRALWLGDMLCIIPTVRAIRHAWPTAHITLIGLPWQSEFVARFASYFDDFIEFPGWPGLPEQKIRSEEIPLFLKTVQDRRFDIVFQMQGNGTVTNKMCSLWKADCVCGLRKSGDMPFDDRHFPVSDDGEHEVLRFLKLLRCFDIPAQGEHLEFPITSEENRAGKQHLARAHVKPRQYVCIHPGARDPRRRWSIEKFAFIANNLVRKGYQIMLTGSAEEQELLSALQMKLEHPAVNVVERFGHLPIGELAFIVKHCKLLISNDTGVSHLAAALSTPSIILFSRWSDINRWHPLSADLHHSIPHERATDPDFVMSSVQSILTRIESKGLPLSNPTTPV